MPPSPRDLWCFVMVVGLVIMVGALSNRWAPLECTYGIGAGLLLMGTVACNVIDSRRRDRMPPTPRDRSCS